MKKTNAPKRKQKRQRKTHEGGSKVVWARADEEMDCGEGAIRQETADAAGSLEV